jgi:excisionase family DNA binding protein
VGIESITMSEQPVLLTKKEVAVLIRKSVRTVESWMKQGLLPHMKLAGRSVLFDREVILANLSKYQVGGSI